MYLCTYVGRDLGEAGDPSLNKSELNDRGPLNRVSVKVSRATVVPAMAGRGAGVLQGFLAQFVGKSAENT